MDDKQAEIVLDTDLAGRRDTFNPGSSRPAVNVGFWVRSQRQGVAQFARKQHLTDHCNTSLGNQRTTSGTKVMIASTAKPTAKKGSTSRTTRSIFTWAKLPQM